MFNKRINLAIADDHVLFRKTLRYFLCERNLNVVMEAADGYDLLEKLRTSSVDILLLDTSTPEYGGHEILRTVHDQYPALKIIILLMSADPELISDLLDAGAYGYISKSDEPEELLRAILTVADNRIYRNRFFTEALYWKKQKEIKTFGGHPYVLLTDREKKMVELIWEEKSSKEIADMLCLGVRSVEKIRQDIKEKIGVKSTVGLIKYAIRKKIIYLNSNRPEQIF